MKKLLCNKSQKNLFYMYAMTTSIRKVIMKLKALLIAISLFFANVAMASGHCTWYIEDRGWCTPYFPTSDATPTKK
jgi:hypothetical protein